MQTLQWVLILIMLVTGVQPAPSFESNNSSKHNKGFIANGNIYDPAEYPYLIRLRMRINWEISGTCTGSLMSASFVLTAAHCTHKIHRFSIKVFRPNIIENYATVHRIYEHPYYNPIYGTADVSLLKLAVPFRDVAKYAILSGHPDEFANNTELSCFVIGFGETGKTNSNYNNNGLITYAKVKYGSEACKLFSNVFIATTWQEFLCSKPDEHMICPGDSGGPLICNGFQYGIASHGYNFVDKNKSLIKCGSSDIQTRHLFIYHYKKWILTTIENTGNSLTLHHKLYSIIFALSSFTITNFIL